jgi:hypothetical protein
MRSRSFGTENATPLAKREWRKQKCFSGFWCLDESLLKINFNIQFESYDDIPLTKIQVH